MSLGTMTTRILGFTMRCIVDWTLRPIRSPGQDTWEARYWPGRNFTPEQFNGKITVFRVNDQPVYRVRRRDLGWCEWATEGVQIHDMPGEHNTMLREPNVGETAAGLLRCLDRVHASRSEGNSQQKLAKDAVSLHINGAHPLEISPNGQ